MTGAKECAGGQKRIFLSYSRDDLKVVADVSAKLRARGFDVFFDRKSLKGSRFDDKIKAEVWNCDLFVFFVSSSSIRQNAYTRNELAHAETRWADPSSQVLAIRVNDFSLDDAPAYLRAVLSVRTVEGNLATGAYNLIVEAAETCADLVVMETRSPADMTVAECADRLADALSRRRKLPPTGRSTAEVVLQIDELAASIRARFRPDEGACVAGARLVKVIGVGNFGTVWEGAELSTGQRVAVKIFRLERLTEGQMLFRFKKSIRAMRLLSEVRRLAKQKEAAGSVVGFLVSDPTELAFSMQLLTGGNLDDIQRHGWTLSRKIDVTTRICIAVAYSHANGVIHRDIKPANIVLDESGQPVLTDFDIADVKFATSMSTTVEGGLGTPVFAAPEQLQNAELANERSDIYSIGRLLYYLLLEHSPGYQVETDPSLANLSRLPPALVAIVRRATQHDANKRYASALELIRALGQCQTGRAAWRARLSQGLRWSRLNWAPLFIGAFLVSAGWGAALINRDARIREEARADQQQRLLEEVIRLKSDKRSAEKELQEANAQIVSCELKIKNDASFDVTQCMASAKSLFDIAVGKLQDIDRKQADLENRLRASSTNRATLQGLSSPKLADSGTQVRVKELVPQCQSSIECHSNGRCSSDKGTCIAKSDLDCRRSTACTILRQCQAINGACVEEASQWCKGSSQCANAGRCWADNGLCRARSDADCVGSSNCKALGQCSVLHGACVAASDQSCRDSDNCSAGGLCWVLDGSCVAKSAPECASSSNCKTIGRCSLVKASCIAATDADCANSRECLKSGLCRASEGRCVSGTSRKYASKCAPGDPMCDEL